MNPVLSVNNLSVAFGFDKNGNPRDGVKPLQVTDFMPKGTAVVCW